MRIHRSIARPFAVVLGAVALTLGVMAAPVQAAPQENSWDWSSCSTAPIKTSLLAQTKTCRVQGPDPSVLIGQINDQSLPVKVGYRLVCPSVGVVVSNSKTTTDNSGFLLSKLGFSLAKQNFAKIYKVLRGKACQLTVTWVGNLTIIPVIATDSYPVGGGIPGDG